MTWLGCVCSGMLVISLFTIFLIYFQDFINKRESLITSLKLRTGDYPKINLQDKEQVLMLENWPPDLDYKSYLEISYSLTTRDKNHQIVSQKPLSTVPCSGVTIEGEKIQRNKDCLIFSDSEKIGRSVKEQQSTQIEIQISPCKTNCATMETDIDYDEKIRTFFYSYGFYLNMVDSSTNFEKYENPISRGIGASLEVSFSTGFIRKQIIAEQIVIETIDGWFLRSKREDINMQFKEITHASSPRAANGLFALITFEISDTIFKVERTYPNLINFLSDFGGLA